MSRGRSSCSRAWRWRCRGACDLERGFYTPGQTYVIDVGLVGEHRGLGAMANENNWTLDIVDDLGQPMAGYAGSEAVFRYQPEYRYFMARRARETRAWWTFEWTAPAAGVGPLTLYLAILDGDGASDAIVGRTDPFGDDFALLALRMCERQAQPCPLAGIPPLAESTAHCAIAHPGGRAGATGMFGPSLAMLGWWFVGPRRRRRG